MLRYLVLPLIWSLSLHAEKISFSSAEFQEIKEAAEFILRTYPPEGYQYVFVGRSLGPVAALLENQGVNNLIQLPLSQMKDFVDNNSPEVEATLAKHFEAFLPSGSLAQNKTLLFIDFTHQGKTFLQQKFALQNYVKTPAQFLAFMWHKNTEGMQKIKDLGIGVYPVSYTDKIQFANSYGQRFWDGLWDYRYDDWSLYERFVPWRDQGKVFIKRPQYVAMKSELNELLKSEKPLSCAANF